MLFLSPPPKPEDQWVFWSRDWTANLGYIRWDRKRVYFFRESDWAWHWRWGEWWWKADNSFTGRGG